MSNANLFILILSLVAGVAGTGLGGACGALFKNRSGKALGRVLSFAGGVMAGVVAFEMIPEAVEGVSRFGKAPGLSLVVGTFTGGMGTIYLFNRFFDWIERKRQSASRIRNASRNKTAKLVKAGTVMLFAIALHNFPEGMAIGASGVAQIETGAIVALIIAVHNIPEGMAISAPLVSGGVSVIKAVLLSALAGGATVFGALLGLALGGLGAVMTSVCLSVAGGAMLYVTFCEILPQAIIQGDGGMPAASMLWGIVSSIVFVYAF